MAKNDNGVVEFQFASRDDGSKWDKFRKAIYDPQTQQYLGRTPKNWGQLLLFYTIFYIILAALVAICMQGLLATLSDDEPKWKLDESLIGTNPGLGFRPISHRTEDGSLIWYNVTNATTIDKWVHLIDDFLAPYKKPQQGENYVNCNFSQSPPEGKVCITDVSQFGDCIPENKYGYNSNSPCVFLKLNRIYNWVPKYYTEPQPGMPDDLADHIRNITLEKEKEQIWVSCEGEDDVDRELSTTFEYFPKGFAGYYYPYMNTKNYLSPLIAVRIRNPKPNIVITIECRAWAKNIEFRSGALNRAGSVQFEIMIDTESKPVKVVAK